jgi:hypothetical protein
MTIQAWRTVSYLVVPDRPAQLPDVHSTAMRETAPRFEAIYWDTSGPGPKYNLPETRTAFPTVAQKKNGFGRSDRFFNADVFSASRGMAVKNTPGPLRYPAPPSVFDKHVPSCAPRILL